jgi:type IV secretory pathway VirB2 component (pilin)
MLALVRPDSWNLPLFLHVLGATILAGAMASAAIAASASSSPVIPRALPFRILLLVAVPSWLLMRLAGQWIDSKENVPGDPTWLGIGFTVGDIGLVVLVVATGFAWWAGKRPAKSWPRLTTMGLSLLYLAALAVAMWAMSAKPGS